MCGNLSTLPSAPLLLHSPPRLRSSPLRHPQSLPAKGLPSVWKTFLLHSSVPLVQVPSLFFCLFFFFFLLPYPGTWGVSCLLGGLRSSSSVQWVFYRSSSTCRCISDVSVGRKVISTSYSSAIFSLSPLFLLFSSSCEHSFERLFCDLWFFVSLQFLLGFALSDPFHDRYSHYFKCNLDSSINLSLFGVL